MDDDLAAGFGRTGLFPYNPELKVGKAYEEPVRPSIPSESPENVQLLMDYALFLETRCSTTFSPGSIRKMETQMKENIDRKHLFRCTAECW